MNILHVNASDILGGAARAAYRIHRSLADHGTNYGLHSQMRVVHRASDDPTVIGGPPEGFSPIWTRLHPRLTHQARRGFSTQNPTWHSLAWFRTGLGSELFRRHLQGQADLVHLHWLGDITLSIDEIGQMPMPLVWTLHDQWAFCGAEHYTTPPRPGEANSSDNRFCVGYTHASRPSHESGPDLNRRTWLRKRRSWRRLVHIVSPSHWLADCVRLSPLMGEWPITVIPYPIDLNVWAPCDQDQARALLNLPLDRPLVLMGAFGGTRDPRKGADILFDALNRLRLQVADTSLEHVELLVFGESRPTQPPVLRFPIHYFGHLHDDLTLRILYAAADVMVVPSRQEAFGQTASEAHACGTPVVAFRTGGLVDIVDHCKTGILADPFDSASLSQAIRWVLEDPQRLRHLGFAARERSMRWDSKLIAASYADVYRRAYT